ncbi:MAG: hypothetical protein ACRCUP_01200 [Mycoplasmatales bacterium]
MRKYPIKTNTNNWHTIEKEIKKKPIKKKIRIINFANKKKYKIVTVFNFCKVLDSNIENMQSEVDSDILDFFIFYNGNSTKEKIPKKIMRELEKGKLENAMPLSKIGSYSDIKIKNKFPKRKEFKIKRYIYKRLLVNYYRFLINNNKI